jgi:hypothetical protein
MNPIELEDGTWTARCYFNDKRCPSLWKAEFLQSEQAAQKELLGHYRQQHPEFVRGVSG